MSLNQQISHLYDQYAEGVKQHNVFITREDGTVVFTNKKHTDSQASLTVAAWQAIGEIKKMNNLQQDSKSFRLSFDISDQGVYVLCFQFMKQSYFASMVYRNVVNPALLKREFQESIRNIATNLEQAFSEPRLQNNKANSKFLFQNISDDELDKVFSDLRGDHVIC